MPNLSYGSYVWIFAKKEHYVESILIFSFDVFQLRHHNFYFKIVLYLGTWLFLNPPIFIFFLLCLENRKSVIHVFLLLTLPVQNLWKSQGSQVRHRNDTGPGDCEMNLLRLRSFPILVCIAETYLYCWRFFFKKKKPKANKTNKKPTHTEARYWRHLCWILCFGLCSLKGSPKSTPILNVCLS